MNTTFPEGACMVRGGYCSWVLDTTFNLFEKS